MRVVLDNGVLRAEFESLRAELKSLVRNDREYMWQGDMTYWGFTSPVLFPFVGSLNKGCFRYGGKEYPMSQHGFARDHEFVVVEKSRCRVVFEYCSDEESLRVFPFRFVFRIAYELTGCSLGVGFSVSNPGSERLYFSLGAHPAFNCPIYGEESKEGYRLYFEGLDELRYFVNERESRLVVKDEHVLRLTNHRAVLNKEFFSKYTYIVEGSKTCKVGLEDRNGYRFIEVDFDAPLFALWSAMKCEAPFVCIEPWFGRGDEVGFNGDIGEREYGNRLDGGGCF